MRVGSVVKFYRNKRGLSQMSVSKAVGHKTAEWLGMIENNVRALDIEKIPAIAGLLRLDARDLLRIAMFEYYPKVAEALFPDDSPHAPAEVESAPPAKISAQAMDLAVRLDRLSPEQLRVFGQMADMVLGISPTGRLRPGVEIHIDRSKLT